MLELTFWSDHWNWQKRNHICFNIFFILFINYKNISIYCVVLLQLIGLTCVDWLSLIVLDFLITRTVTLIVSIPVSSARLKILYSTQVHDWTSYFYCMKTWHGNANNGHSFIFENQLFSAAPTFYRNLEKCCTNDATQS